MVIPALVSASTDARLRGAPMGVYVWLLCHHLDVEAWRPLKFYAMARELGVKPHTAGRAVRVLLAAGYLDRRGANAGDYEYRLRLTHLKPCPETA